MLTAYLFSALVGGGLLAFSLSGFGDSSSHDFAGHDAGADHSPFKFLSIRTATYFLFVFGGVGAVLTWAWQDSVALIAALATVSGLGVAALASALFQYLARTHSGDRQSDESFVGLSGRVTLPISPDGMGKVVVQRGDRSYELLARPFDTRTPPATWKSVVVVEMRRGTAIVSPVDDTTL